VEAPLSYFLGVPTSALNCIDKSLLKDIVVFGLDQAGSPDFFMVVGENSAFGVLTIFSVCI
jgi:hypothetical protein